MENTSINTSAISPSANIGLMGGTGLNQFQSGSVSELSDTPYGPISAGITVTSIAGQKVAFLARHGSPHHIPPHKINYRANLWALKQLGVSQLLAVNAVGGINPNMPAGSIVIPDQIVDYSYGREHTYYDGIAVAGSGFEPGALEHIDISYPFDAVLRERLLAAAGVAGLDVVDGGVYGVTQGPRLETAAEVNRLDRDGCDIVGMTAMPEAALARELAMAYASICLVVNPAAGRSESLITMEDIHRVVDRGMARVRQLLVVSLELL